MSFGGSAAAMNVSIKNNSNLRKSITSKFKRSSYKSKLPPIEGTIFNEAKFKQLTKVEVENSRSKVRIALKREANLARLKTLFSLLALMLISLYFLLGK